MTNNNLYYIGKRLKTIRESKEITQKALSEAAGISRKFLNQMETGKMNFSINTLEAVASALDCQLHIAIIPQLTFAK